MPTNIHSADTMPREYSVPRHSDPVVFTAGEYEPPAITTCLHVGAAGDIVVEEMGAPGVARTYKAVPVGMFVGRFVKIIEAGTTAGDIVARW